MWFGQAGPAASAALRASPPQPRELREVALESARGDDLEQAGGLVGAVPERVPDAARLEHEVAGLRVQHLVADLHADLALEHVGVLVLVLVDVHRRGECRGAIGCSTSEKPSPAAM